MSKQTFKKFYGICRKAAAGRNLPAFDEASNRYVISGGVQYDMSVACGMPVSGAERAAMDAAMSAMLDRALCASQPTTPAQRLAAQFYAYD